jgi:hypothetical protein
MLVACRLAGLSALGAPYAGRQMARKFKADTTLLKALVGNGGYSVRLHRRLARRGGMGRARPSGPQCGRSHRAAGGVFALESNLIVCARDRWGTLRCNSVHKGNKFDRRVPTPGGKNGGYAYVYDCTIIFRKRLERIV